MPLTISPATAVSKLPLGSRFKIVGFDFSNLKNKAYSEDELVLRLQEAGFNDNTSVEICAKALGVVGLRNTEFAGNPVGLRHDLADTLQISNVKVGKKPSIKEIFLGFFKH